MTLKEICKTDKKYIIGIDECGTGSLFGDVYVCAFAAPKNWNMEGLNDSKKLSANKREYLAEKLMHCNDVGYNVSFVNPNNILEYEYYGNNLHGALKYLYRKSAGKLYIDKSTLIVLDGNIKFPEVPYKLCNSISLPKADGLIPQVMAASIIGKVFRDNYMKQMHKIYPNYDFENNKGYPSKKHKEALLKYGITKEHRVSYKSVSKILGSK